MLYNAWDAGSAKAIAEAGAPVIATSSWAVAAAQGFEDGESLPFDLLEQTVARIVAVVDLPVTVDVEGGYDADPSAGAQNISRLVDLGVAGINFEDRIVPGSDLHDIKVQSTRIAAIRRMAEARGVQLFINARTDVFFYGSSTLSESLKQARERAHAYIDAGASGLFVPGLADLETIADLCATIELPLNVMVAPGLPDHSTLADAGVSRISYGPGSYLSAMASLRTSAEQTKLNFLS
ncbi:isocitrate lyase/PEP mutase family protein [Diaphorobacter aerolatus]|uniref:isocitrate lyase/PEP mutase family protein n=1 Tax=Diaphorobacter aerolatus TaxID=1288495 RepID=UPI0021F7E027|nr:isocitrate lyase/phosphoenolpyruvate mutase family protein [Diaphorobacter aerolatus]